MLTLQIPGGEFWDEAKREFMYIKPCTLKLEHSLVSISKWESKWCISFFESEKTNEQILDYIKCMTLNKDVDQNVYNALTPQQASEINNYISAPMTATTIAKDEKASKGSHGFMTSELIYYYMISYNIPVEFEKWHINRLITLIRVCSEENKPKKKSNPKDLARRYREINNARLAKYNTKG
jgi:hypothetical protein